MALLILEDINFRPGHMKISLSGSKAISNRCKESVLCFVWNSFLHYLHRSKSHPFFEYRYHLYFFLGRSLSSLSQLELIFHTSKAGNNCISVISNTTYSLLTCPVIIWVHNVSSLMNY